MPARPYTASLSQSQERSGYSIIFRHPARRDRVTGKLGLRVRMGLETRDQVEAEGLKAELNALLADPKFHDPAAREEAAGRFSKRAVEIFFHGMVPEAIDFLELRERSLPLPPAGVGGHRRVILLGTTGAGKTTLGRQLMGTDPRTERFPSTSTAKTTIHDTEIIMIEGPWRAVVTFVPAEETRDYLKECISAAVLAASKDHADDAMVLRRLLNHVNQRFRFSYVLGTGTKIKGGGADLEDEDEEEQEEGLFSAEELGVIDLAETEQVLATCTKQLRELGQRLGEQLRMELNARPDKEDERVIEEIFEEELDNLLREEDAFDDIADALMEEIEKRFDLLPPGKVTKTRQGWPITWSGEWPAEQRKEFMRAIVRFSSNYSPFFGRLLTPLVNGVRVSGPFAPTWKKGPTPKLVLLDGEGLGHTPKSSSSVSTSVSRRMESADAIVLVDNATQPLQAAPLAAMREVVATGNARKLIVAFTHFDAVKGDNLPNMTAKVQHVLESAENVLASFGEELGPHAERALRMRLETAKFFLANLQEPLSQDSAGGRRTIGQLESLLDAIDQVIERPKLAKAQPMYDRMDLALAIRGAADAFHGAWRPLLGLQYKPGYVKEHWTRVKALSRRLGTGMADEYDTLKPVADLRRELVERIFVFAQNPLRWEGIEPSEEEKHATIDALADNLGKRLLDLATRRIWHEKAKEWELAYFERGTGSTFVRARVIGSDIYESAAPVPDVAPSPDRNQFLREVGAVVEAAAEEVGAKLV